MNFYKKLMFVSLCIFLPAALQAQFEMPELSGDDLSALQQDVAAIDEFIKSLPPEEQRKIEEEAFKILSEMPEEDLEQFMKLSEQITEGMEIPEEAPIQEAPKKEEITEKVIDTRAQEQEKQKKLELRKTISTIIEHIDSLISKTQSMPRISDRPNVEKRWTTQLRAIEEFRALLEHLINPVSGDKDMLISKLILDENNGYRSELNQVKSTLRRLVPTIKLPDAMGLKKADPNALRSLNQVITDVENLSLSSLTDKTRELIKKYAPKELPTLRQAQDDRGGKDYPRPTRDYSGDSDYGYRPSYAGGGGGYPDYYGDAGAYQDDFYVPSAQRTADAGRYVQRTPQAGRQKRRGAGRQRRTQPGKRAARKAPKSAGKKPGKTVPGAKILEKQRKLKEQTEKEMKGLLEALTDVQKKGAGPIKDGLFLGEVDQYLKATGPVELLVDNRLVEVAHECSIATKKMKTLNISLKKFGKQEQELIREGIEKDIKEMGLTDISKKLTDLKEDTYAPSKRTHTKAVERFTKACNKLIESIEGEKPDKKKQKNAPKA